MRANNYVRKSLELHLFFSRIMKEHSLFLKAGFTPANSAFSNKAQFYMKEFEKLLCQTVNLSNGIVSNEVLNSGEIVTKFTALAEKQTEHFTGIPINKEITDKELHLKCNETEHCNYSQKSGAVKKLNQMCINLLDGLISFKETILRNVLECNMFTMNYPLLIEHIIREAKLYRKYIAMLERDGNLSHQTIKEFEYFWNRIMMEHALFIRGLLDPTENELISSANDFANDYSALLENCRNTHNKTIQANSLETTIKFKDFKTAGTEGITQCNIRSVILPLLADHVLREANHYIRLLKC